MKKALAIAGILALSITPTASFSDHWLPLEKEIRPGGNLFHTYLRGRDLSGVDLSGANLGNSDLFGANLNGTNLSGADLWNVSLLGLDLSTANPSGVKASVIRGCPLALPSGWICRKNGKIYSLIQLTLENHSQNYLE
tara:strand:- start:12 stop:425 length:414 start_codon:yes stop_codon:yes gene_type:complete